MVTVVWDMRVEAGSATTGRDLIRRIWADMKGFSGYLSHRLLQDADEPGHFIVVSEWTERQRADATREIYADAEPVRLLTPILVAPRQRFVTNDCV